MNLAEIGTSRRLESCLQLGNGQLTVSTKMMATTIEALIGAVHLDSGEGNLNAVKGVMDNLGIAYQEPIMSSCEISNGT